MALVHDNSIGWFYIPCLYFSILSMTSNIFLAVKSVLYKLLGHEFPEISILRFNGLIADFCVFFNHYCFRWWCWVLYMGYLSHSMWVWNVPFIYLFCFAAFVSVYSLLEFLAFGPVSWSKLHQHLDQCSIFVGFVVIADNSILLLSYIGIGMAFHIWISYILWLLRKTYLFYNSHPWLFQSFMFIVIFRKYWMLLLAIRAFSNASTIFFHMI